MNDTVIFLITKQSNGFKIENKHYSEFTMHCIPQNKLFKAMFKLADIFNNRLNLGILFAIE